MGQFFCKQWCGKKETKVIILGLDGAGKTTILYKLKLGEIVTTIPTIGFNVETVQYKNIDFITWDIGLRDKMRPLLKHYYQIAEVVIFVVDSTDVERIKDARDEITITLDEDELRDCVIVVIANKQDLTNALPKDEVANLLELDKIQKSRTCEIFSTSAVTGEGLYDVMDWLACQRIAKKPSSTTKLTNDKNITKHSKIEDNDEPSKYLYLTRIFLHLKSMMLD